MMSAATDTCDQPDKLQIGMETSLRMFATREGQTLQACRDDYLAFLRWRIDMDRHAANGRSAEYGGPPAPASAAGDALWVDPFGRRTPAPGEARVVRSLPHPPAMAT